LTTRFSGADKRRVAAPYGRIFFRRRLQLISVLCRHAEVIVPASVGGRRVLLRVAREIYGVFVIVGIGVAASTYGVFAAVSGAPLGVFVSFTLPLMMAFCLTASVPLAALASIVSIMLQRSRPRASALERTLVGGILGVMAVLAALAPFLRVGPLGSPAGILFWATFLVAGCLSGGWASVRAARRLNDPGSQGIAEAA
jgi:hypothetical protein